MTKEKLIRKYNVPAPRYTSYPTVPFWNKEVIGSEKWLEMVGRTFSETNQEKGISLYIHLPFCESLCTYCGCNKRITKNHKVEGGYIDAVLAEWNIYKKSWHEKPIIRELHLGGGTPTFFSPENLYLLLQEILKDCNIHPEWDFSFEGHPNNTTAEHLKVLFELGFRRVSFGIQDLDVKVQKAINRIQPYVNVKTVTDLAREIGYTSVNFDLIYGLPFQNVESISNTIHQISELMPDRIAFYSYAHVPWLKPGQRGYSEKDLPDDGNKRELYETGREMFLSLGYKDVGMDHFSLPGDALYIASEKEALHRNFMGYTVCNTELLIGLGTSAISDAKYGYMQNEKVVEHYKEKVIGEELAIFKSHIMTNDEVLIRKKILQLLCIGKMEICEELNSILHFEALQKFKTMEEEGLLGIVDNQLQVKELGKAFIRNIAMILDVKLDLQVQKEPLFSKSI